MDKSTAAIGKVKNPEISVVIPVYRSEEIVPDLCQALREALDLYSFEVVLVNDRSPDGSWDAIRREASKDERIVGINLRINVGQDRAIMAGLNHVSGDFIVVMDDDMQHLPSDIPTLYEEVRKGYDVCYANFFRKKQTAMKNLYSWAAGKVSERLLHKPPHIYMSPFKIMRREAVDEILRYRGPFPYVDGLLFQITANISQITVEHQERYAGETTHNFWNQARVFLNLVTNFSILPLRLMTVLGGISAVTSFLIGVYFLVIYMTVGIEVLGWTPLVLLILFFGGMILLALGLIGEYLGRVLINVNQTPQFVVEERVNYKGEGKLDAQRSRCRNGSKPRKTQQ